MVSQNFQSVCMKSSMPCLLKLCRIYCAGLLFTGRVKVSFTTQWLHPLGSSWSQMGVLKICDLFDPKGWSHWVVKLTFTCPVNRTEPQVILYKIHVTLACIWMLMTHISFKHDWCQAPLKCTISVSDHDLLSRLKGYKTARTSAFALWKVAWSSSGFVRVEYVIRAWNLSLKWGFLRKWNFKKCGKIYFSWKRSQQAYFFFDED